MDVLSGQEPAAPAALALVVRDFAGDLQPPHQVPLRPKFYFTRGHGTGGALSAVLLPGETKSGDLLKMQREHSLKSARAGGVTLTAFLDEEGAGFTPAGGLARGVAYTLVALEREHSAVRAFPLRAAVGPDAGSELMAAWPAHNAVDVPPNTRRTTLGLSGTLRDNAPRVVLLAQGRVLQQLEATALPCPQPLSELVPFCWSADLRADLPPNAVVEVTMHEDTRDAHHAPVMGAVSFATAGVPDVEAPHWSAERCTSSKSCLLVADTEALINVVAPEPVSAKLHFADTHLEAILPHGEHTFHLSGLTPGADNLAELVMEDLAGNKQAWVLELQTSAPLPPLAITEVRANPLGEEPSQEYIELLNYGNREVLLDSLWLSQNAAELEVEVASDHMIQPHQRVILATEGFQADNGEDPPVRPGVRILRLKELSSRGLSNDGEAVWLLDSEHRVVSSAPAVPTPKDGTCVARKEQGRFATATTFSTAPLLCTPGQ